MNRIGIINRSAPYSGQAGQESVDLALAAASFGQQVSIFFVDDGVFQLLPNQKPSQLERKDFTKSFGAFEFYDIDNIYVCQQSLEKRGMSNAQLTVDVKVLNGADFNQVLSQHQHLVTLV